jgi:hypothetical protein
MHSHNVRSWRNRGAQPVTITLKVEGAYSELKKM